ncbi:protein of unknown function [Azospirillum lipoferum 4B]|uniref:Uncharacterized protein n=1 Tax=Azospirillum lipoferum (strain 4B) TaxID=862719 RepID=G7Z619_AZOL4|nr:protein of unknown function [Azospirillum lipoferum 4B]
MGPSHKWQAPMSCGCRMSASRRQHGHVTLDLTETAITGAEPFGITMAAIKEYVRMSAPPPANGCGTHAAAFRGCVHFQQIC